MINLFKISVILTFVYSLSAAAQTPIPRLDLNQFRGVLVSETGVEIAGSQYIEEAFLSAKISVIGDQVVDVRYNVVKDEMEFKRDNIIYQMYKTDSLTISFINENKIYKVVDYTYKDRNFKGFLISKTTNENVNFLMKEVIRLVPFKSAVNSYSQDVPTHYKKDANIYLLQLKSEIVEMPNSKKNLIKLFPNHSAKIEEFLKANKTDFDKEDSVLILVNFLNTL